MNQKRVRLNEQLSRLEILEEGKTEIMEDYFNPLKIIQGYRFGFEKNLEEVLKLNLKGELAYYYLQKDEKINKYRLEDLD